MTFNTLLRLGCALAMVSAAQCLQNPAKTAWGDEEEYSIRSRYQSLQMAVQDSAGIFYGSDGHYLLRFDSTAFVRNEAPDSLDIRDGVRKMYLDVKGDVILFHTYGASLVRHDGDILRLDSIHNEEMSRYGITPITNEDGTIWSVTQNGDILSWDGAAMTTHARLFIPPGYRVAGIFPFSGGLQVITQSQYRMSRYFIDDSGPTEYELQADSCLNATLFRLGGQIYGIGAFGSYLGTRQYRIFMVAASDTLRLVNKVPADLGYGFLQTATAVYLKGYRSIYKFTPRGSKWTTFSDALRGPLFLDRSGRASMLYTPTRRIMLIDSLPGWRW